jgi:hypothetical protein
MDPVRSALVTKLTGDATLAAMLSGAGAIYHRRAPRTARTPFIVFDLNAGSSISMFGGGEITDDVWMIKAVDNNSSASRAEDIDLRIKAVLHGSTIPLTGGGTASVLRETRINYAENEGDDTWQHVGATYRVKDP